MWTPLLILSGCAYFDPELGAAIEYIEKVQPLMAENSLLAERTLVLASELHDKKADDAKVLEVWTNEIVPLSQHLHMQAGQLDPPELWKDSHGELVTIWTDRTAAYRDFGEAIVLADSERWDRARTQYQTMIDREQAWFQGTAARLQPYELTLEQYP